MPESCVDPPPIPNRVNGSPFMPGQGKGMRKEDETSEHSRWSPHAMRQWSRAVQRCHAQDQSGADDAFSTTIIVLGCHTGSMPPTMHITCLPYQAAMNVVPQCLRTRQRCPVHERGASILRIAIMRTGRFDALPEPRTALRGGLEAALTPRARRWMPYRHAAAGQNGYAFAAPNQDRQKEWLGVPADQGEAGKRHRKGSGDASPCAR